ncbi:MAG: hypothetical protein Q8Q02_12500 [Nocardioides sp.]|nr:hypothetical protein [Nocardioides sp.]
MTPTDTSDYRLSRPLVARLVGAYLVVFALVVFAATAIVAATGVVPPDLLAVLLVLGLIGLGGVSSWLRAKAYVVRLDPAGYEVRLVRGAGVKKARWSDVEDVVTASPRDIPCVVLRLRDGGTTTIPVEALAVDREQFVHELRAHLDRGQGLRPL